ncbi:MAG: DUF3365 domain-containing protein, partial [Lachnospiraceae bacterium]|nr:DUF3365 domain-containing protein [Lachnospiraceae bacterium]
FSTMRTQYQVILDNLHVKAQLIAREQSAVWQFMTVNQELINTTWDGNYEFKGLHCAVVGKSVSAIFSKGNDLMTLHYTNLQTRNFIDAPDSFEKRALRAMKLNPGVWEYYEVVEESGQQVFRYLSSLTVTESCLECHGEPAGEIDKTGYAKEGWKVGDMGGAISMKLSMEDDLVAYHAAVRQNILFAALSLLLVSLAVAIGVRGWVTKPLRELEAGVREMKGGNLEIPVKEAKLSNEFQTLGHDFNAMARELSHVYENLEQKVELRTEELQTANRMLEEQKDVLDRANQMLKEDVDLKNSFLNMMSHELRTPLTSILAFTNILLESDMGEEEKSSLREIRVNSNHLLGMINNTLELARLEAGRSVMNRELVELGDVLGSLEAMIAPVAAQKQIAFLVEIDGDVPLVWADAGKLRHILENLCSNAIKFTPEGGQVRIWVEESEPGALHIHVEDNGVGMSESEQAVIFERFVQADSSESRRYNGSGLGLSLAKEMAELHGGSITVVSKKGEGSCFTLHLPLKQGE